MQFPLTEDIFLSLDPTKNIDLEFFRVFIRAVNKWYEEGKKAERSRFCMTSDILKTVYKRFYNEEPKEDAVIMFFDVTAEFMNAAWQQGLMDSGKMFSMPLEVIQLYPCFIERPPKEDKVERKEKHFEETGILQSPIILNSDNYLIDGFTSYLLAKRQGIQYVPVRYGKRQIVRASHRQGSKLYTWELPQELIDKVSVGNKVIAHTQKGPRTVRVVIVEEYKPQEHTKALKKVIRIKRKKK